MTWTRRADAVAVQENHDLPHDLLFGPGFGDSAGAHGPDAVDLPQPVGLGCYDVEYLLAEGSNELARIDWTDPADHAGRQVFLDALYRGRR
jgi:hypothetical protein